MEWAIEVEALSRSFGSFRAVSNLSFNVARGTIFGLLGPNGAGKSTTLRMLTGLLTPSSGRATIAGYDLRRQPEQIKAAIGYMSQRFSLYEELTAGENIDFYNGVYAVQKKKERKAWALSLAGLTEEERTLTRELPGGARQRLALACALLHEPKILFLDEPTSGMAPHSQRAFWSLIDAEVAAGTTVIVTTHAMNEAAYCHKIAFINRGALIASDAPLTLQRSHRSPDGKIPSLEELFVLFTHAQGEPAPLPKAMP